LPRCHSRNASSARCRNKDIVLNNTRTIPMRSIPIREFAQTEFFSIRSPNLVHHQPPTAKSTENVADHPWLRAFGRATLTSWSARPRGKSQGTGATDGQCYRGRAEIQPHAENTQRKKKTLLEKPSRKIRIGTVARFKTLVWFGSRDTRASTNVYFSPFFPLEDARLDLSPKEEGGSPKKSSLASRSILRVKTREGRPTSEFSLS